MTDTKEHYELSDAPTEEEILAILDEIFGPDAEGPK